MIRSLNLLFILSTSTVLGQSLEQKALNFLANAIYGEVLQNSSGNFKVTKDSSKIWFYPNILYTQTKLHLEHGITSGENKFYKVVHSGKDIFVKTKMASDKGEVVFVPFEILTNYGKSFQYMVIFENNQAVKLTKTSD